VPGIRDGDLPDGGVEESAQAEGTDVELRRGRDPERDPADGVEEDLAVGEPSRLETPGVLRVGGKEEVERRAVLDLREEAPGGPVRDDGPDARRRGGRRSENGVERELQVGGCRDADLAGLSRLNRAGCRKERGPEETEEAGGAADSEGVLQNAAWTRARTLCWRGRPGTSEPR
jgi:hypothetical protein